MDPNNRYNGWTNWETWIVNLWMDNDQKLYQHFLDITREEVSGNKELCTFTISVILREYFDEWAPEIDGLYLDLLNGAMREVNWREIALHLIEQLSEEETYIERAN